MHIIILPGRKMKTNICICFYEYIPITIYRNKTCLLCTPSFTRLFTSASGPPPRASSKFARKCAAHFFFSSIVFKYLKRVFYYKHIYYYIYIQITILCSVQKSYIRAAAAVPCPRLNNRTSALFLCCARAV